MVNPHVAYTRRAAWLKAKGVNSESDLQYIVYTNNWQRPLTPAAGDVAGAQFSQSFPASATLIIGIQGGCTPDAQPSNPYVFGNERYRVSFQYNVNQVGLVTSQSQQGGLAVAVFGQFGDQFPAREIALEANDTIAVVIQSTNVSDTAITGSTEFHCLIWKFAQ